MKKIILLILTFVILTVAVSARPVKRIKFARGATRASATGSLNGYKDSQTFLIRIREGQTLTTEQIRSRNSLKAVTVYITDPNGEGVGDSDASCDSRREITPTIAGDYKIKIVECQKADRWSGSFNVRVTVK